MIKAIETVYKGYRFRSRLEARWAVFFDTAGILYEYEKEGFDLGQVGWYLPDFWLPQQEYWIEIKPNDVSLEQARSLGATLAALAKQSQYSAFVLVGDPWFPMQGGYDSFSARSGGGWGSSYWWAECPTCKSMHLTYCGNVGGGVCCLPNTVECYPGFDSDRLGDAYRAARGARFEHGEKG